MSRRLAASASGVFATLFAADLLLAASPKPVPRSEKAAAFGVSPRFADMPAARPDPNSKYPLEWERPNDAIPRSERSVPDGASQDAALPLSSPAGGMPGPSLTFAGLTADDDEAAFGSRFVPPDTVGDVGPNHYVQSVNALVRVYDKSGAPLTAIVDLETFFGGLGPGCARNEGDPIVLYDPLADRWLISQFGLPNYPDPPFHQCIAISQTGDATGSYFLYDFDVPDLLNDYPHFGVWPDGYYMSDNQFTPPPQSWAGAGLFAFERAKMLIGDPTASYIYFNYGLVDPNAGGMLPSDLDGLVPPPPGTPNLFMEWRANEFGDPDDALRIYEFHADFANPPARR